MDDDTFVTKTTKKAMVVPSSKSPQAILPLVSLDLFKPNIQVKNVYYYKSNGSSNVLDFELLKEALAKTLVPFYAFAGRLRRDRNGRFEIVCNDEGVPLVEVEADATIEDFGEFTPSLKLNQLLHHVDYTKDLSSRPMLHLQVTRFKCGGASLGIGFHEFLGDAQTFAHFINSWSRIARGKDIEVLPSFDRTILQARVPPRPIFPHKYYYSHPTLDNNKNNSKPSSSSFTSMTLLKVTRAQLDLLKARCKGEVSTFVSLTSHVWKCVTRACHLTEDQDTDLVIPYTGRGRLPLMPSCYLGSVMFLASLTSKARQVVASDELSLAREIKESFTVMTEEYMRSAIDFLELQNGKAGPLKEEEEEEKDVSMLIMDNLLRVPFYDADFGWGKPIFLSPANVIEYLCLVMPSPTMDEDGSVTLAFVHKGLNMEEFKKLFFEPLQ